MWASGRAPPTAGLAPAARRPLSLLAGASPARVVRSFINPLSPSFRRRSAHTHETLQREVAAEIHSFLQQKFREHLIRTGTSPGSQDPSGKNLALSEFTLVSIQGNFG